MLNLFRPRVWVEGLRSFFERWDNWVGDRDMELAIRRRLSSLGYRGQGAKLSGVRLAAIKRPGWLQLYQFDAAVRNSNETFDVAQQSDNEELRLFGIVSLDSRTQAQPIVECFEQPHRRAHAIDAWKKSNDVL